MVGGQVVADETEVTLATLAGRVAAALGDAGTAGFDPAEVAALGLALCEARERDVGGGAPTEAARTYARVEAVLGTTPDRPPLAAVLAVARAAGLPLAPGAEEVAATDAEGAGLVTRAGGGVVAGPLDPGPAGPVEADVLDALATSLVAHPAEAWDEAARALSGEVEPTTSARFVLFGMGLDPDGGGART